MKSSRTQDFRKLFVKLPQRVKETAKKNYELWKENLFHSSLEFKEVKPKENIWSVRVGIGWRVLGVMKSYEDVLCSFGLVPIANTIKFLERNRYNRVHQENE